jgi:ATP-binding cassette, subfamily B, bacterial PglK
MKYNYFKLLETKKDKTIFISLIFFIFIGSLLETIGIAAVYPILSLILSDSSDFTSNFYVQNLNNFFGTNFYEKKNLIFVSIFFFLIFFIFKNLYLFFSKFFSESFLFGLKHNLSSKMMRNILLRSYENFIKNNSSYYTNLTLNVVGELVNNIFVAFIFMVKELIFVLLIIILLSIYNFKITFASILGFIIISMIFLFFSKKKLSTWSEKKVIFDDHQIKNLFEAFSLIKFIKITNAENFFLKQFNKNNFHTNMISRNLVALNYSPNLFFETIIVLFMSILILYLTFMSKIDLVDIIPFLGVVMLAALRLRPSVGQIVNSFNSLRFGKVFIEKYMENIIIDKDQSQKNYKGFNENIKLIDLSFSYNGKVIVEKLNFEIVKGDIIGITGKTGSGKTSLVEVIMGLKKKTNGEIILDNLEISNESLFKLINFGYVPQDTFLLNDTLKNNIVFNREVDNKYLEYVIELCELKKFANSLELGLDTLIKENGKNISGGQKQRIGLARALYQKPDILILDESTNALDSDTSAKIYEKIKDNKITSIIISHQIESLQNCNKKINLE